MSSRVACEPPLVNRHLMSRRPHIFWPSAVARAPVAVVHDHIVQFSGGERVVLAMAEALGRPPVLTAFYDPELTYDGFDDVDVRASRVNRWSGLRRRHRLAFPLMAAMFSELTVDAEVTVCSSAGWSHGAEATGAKLAYLYAPPRWLYQTDSYLSHRLGRARLPVLAMRRYLSAWDRRAVGTIDRALTSSRAVRDRLWSIYRLEAEILPPPVTLGSHPTEAVPGVPDRFLLCVARLLAYKNVDVAIAAAARVGLPLVVVGRGPEHPTLQALAGSHAVFLDKPSDAQLRWLYQEADALVAVAHEDFGLTPIEANALGTPAVAIAAGGYLDTVLPGRTGVLAGRATEEQVTRAINDCLDHRWDADELRLHAGRFGVAAFGAALRSHVNDLANGPLVAAPVTTEAVTAVRRPRPVDDHGHRSPAQPPPPPSL